MKNKNQKGAFTFVELIITSTIIILLGTLGFYSYSKYSSSSRDSERISDMKNIDSSLRLYKQKRGYFPIPGDTFIIKNGTIEIAYQGKLNEKVALSSLDKIPLDPLLKIPYIYSITKNKQDFQIATTLENDGNPVAFVMGSYETVSKNILPSIVIAYNGSGSIDITNNNYKNKFIIDDLGNNLPYSIDTGIPFHNVNTSFSGILENPNKTIIQNTSFKSCDEIYESKKAIGDGEYQILDENGKIINVQCNFLPVGTTKVALCGGVIPFGADWNTSPNYTKTWDGANWLPTKNANYDINPSTEDCRFKCQNNYTWDGSSCIISETLVSGHCTSLPTNALYYNNSSNYSLVDAPSGTSLDALSAGYSSSPDDNTCQFKCNSGYSWNGSSCIISETLVSGPCTSLPTNALYYNNSSNYSLVDAPTGTSLDALSAGYGPSPSNNTCEFKCNSGYSWNGSSCIISETLVSGPCTSLPTNALYYNNSSNYSLVDAPTGTSLDALSAGYGPSPSNNTCEFKCNSGYSWNGSSCIEGESLFVSAWKTNNMSDGSSSSNQVNLPLIPSGNYNFTVDWGDGTSDTINSWNQEEKNHTYSSEGTYTIEISGTIEGFAFFNGGDKDKIINISSWGPLNLGNSGYYFNGASHLTITATDILNLSGTTIFDGAFSETTSLTNIPNINSWNLSNVTSMSEMFYKSSFDGYIGDWNTSNVNNMCGMFIGANNFNQDIGSWNTSNVTCMWGMFRGASNFNQNIGNWDTSNVEDMGYMFFGASSFNQNLSSWNTAQVTNMTAMFWESNFNAPIGNWDTSNVTSMEYMFDATPFNQDISNWNTAQVTNMAS
ncbi:BspA family leucine-rich repeat surface protein, partial [Candidatus Gracilibacteria bacterium]|nr:BspA family leucine-rich repeat surface protein [Candidatus Gracilibacteria bacterium]